MTWTRTELEDAFAGYQNTVVECTRSGDWNAFADMFTEDVVYVEHAFGTLNGREAVRKWVTRTMTEFPGHRMTEFPANWFVVDEQRGWIVCEIDNPMEDPGDGSKHGAANITILHYAGNGLWSREEDAYNPMNFLSMAKAWCLAAEAAGTLPMTPRPGSPNSALWCDRSCRQRGSDRLGRTDRTGQRPLPVVPSEDRVQIHADAVDLALVDLELMQVCPRVHIPCGRAPVVLPEPGSDAGTDHCVDHASVSVDAERSVADNRGPPLEVRRDQRSDFSSGRVVVDRRVDRPTGRPTSRRM